MLEVDMKTLKNRHLIALFFLFGNQLTNCMDLSSAAENLRILQDKINKELENAVYMEKKDVVQVLLQLGANPNTELANKKSSGWTALHYAATTTNSEIINQLLKHKANVSAKGKLNNTPLHIAAIHGNTDTVQMLLEAGADPKLKNSKGLTPIDLAQQNGNTELAKLMQPQ